MGFFMFLLECFPINVEKYMLRIRTLFLKNKDESCFEGTHLILWLTVIKDNSNESKRNPAELMLFRARKFHCHRAGSSIASIIVRAICAHFPNYCTSENDYGKRFYFACVLFMEKYFQTHTPVLQWWESCGCIENQCPVPLQFVQRD